MNLLKNIYESTFAEVRKVILDYLRKEGWKVKDDLKIPYAVSSDGKIRLWFKTQAVYGDTEGGTNIQSAHSWISDIRKHSNPESFMKEIKWWSEYEFT